MTEIAIIGVGQTPIGELWDKSLRELAADALALAVQDAGLERIPDALFVSNMMAARLSDQAHLGALIADEMGWSGIEATTVEAACASGGMAVQMAVRALASRMVDVVAVCGVEKMTDSTPANTVKALATAADADLEGIQGATFVALNALLMRRYMYEYNVPHEAFAPFVINAHRNAVHNPRAMFPFEVTPERYRSAPVIADPINLLDSSPICDGAAALILCRMDMAQEWSRRHPIRILASASATDALMAGNRANPLFLRAAQISVQKALAQSGLTLADMDLFELHDAFSIMAALSLEAAGFVEPGRAVEMAANGDIFPGGRLPIATMGGLKARGHPVGATGVYEIADVVTQLRGEAGPNQIANARIGMAQNIGGTGATIVTHILGVE